MQIRKTPEILCARKHLTYNCCKLPGVCEEAAEDPELCLFKGADLTVNSAKLPEAIDEPDRFSSEREAGVFLPSAKDLLMRREMSDQLDWPPILRAGLAGIGWKGDNDGNAMVSAAGNWCCWAECCAGVLFTLC